MFLGDEILVLVTVGLMYCMTFILCQAGRVTMLAADYLLGFYALLVLALYCAWSDAVEKEDRL